MVNCFGTLKARMEGGGFEGAVMVPQPIAMVNMQGSKGNAVAQEDGPSYTLNSMHGHDVHAVLVPQVSGTLGGGSDQRGWSNDLDRSGAFVPQGAVVRRLTPTECCRLQGFPDDWNTWGISKDGKRVEMADSSRYKQLGNAVTVNVAQRIARRVMAAISSSAHAQSC